MAGERKKLTIPDLAAKKQAGERQVMVAVADAVKLQGGREMFDITADVRTS